MIDEPLTDAQSNVFDAIVEFIDARGFAPTIRELCDATGRRSTNAVQEILVRLEAKGAISRCGLSPRTIRVLRGKNGASTRA